MDVDGEVKDQNPSSLEEAGDDLKKKKDKEGSFLLGSPTFVGLGNGRFRCVETGHELPDKDRESYGRTKGCRLALIDVALSKNKPPLNMFEPHSLSKSKLVCKLTGDTINKSEEHIWKHITGKRFHTKLEQKEVEKMASVGMKDKDTKQSKKLLKSTTIAVEKDQKEDVDGNGILVRKSTPQSDDLEETDFWVPPIGSRWDFDDGKDRWESCTSSGPETDDDNATDGVDGEEEDVDSEKLPMQGAKRMSKAVGSSSFASRKKKSKKSSAASTPNGK